MICGRLFSVVCFLCVTAGYSWADIDLGNVPKGISTNIFLTVTNVTSSRMDITNVMTSCECLTVNDWPGTIETGSYGSMKLRLDASESGEYAYEIQLQVDGQKEDDLLHFLYVTVEDGKAKRDAALYATVTDLAKDWRRGKRFTYVDVRREEDYRQAHIPSSLNIPVYALKTKSFLKNKDVVLVDEGWGDEALEAEVRRLKDSGFGSVVIMHGGLNAWYRAGGDIEGRTTTTAGFSLIDPKAFFLCRKYDDCVEVNLDANEDANGHVRAVLEAVERAGDMERVVIISEDGSGYGPIMSELRRKPRAVVFYLSGGMREYKRQAKMWATIQNGGGKAIVRSAGQRARKRCGSCP